MEQQPIELAIQNFPAQEKIFSSPALYTIVPKGRRFGLTKGAANNYIDEALEGSFSKGLWVDTVNANIDRYIERYFVPHLKKLPKNWWHWRRQDNILEIKDAYIDFRSADRPENIEGFGYDKYFVNEAGIVLKNEYLWHNAIKPMLWDYNPRGVIGGTPKGKGIFFDLAEKAKEPNQQRYTLFQYSSFDNPYLNRALLEEEIADMPERVVLQEVYAQFLDDTGVVFRNVKAIADATPQSPQEGHLYVIGLDLAKVQDFTVITVYDRMNNFQVYQERFNHLDWPFQKKKIYAVSKHYNNALVIPDATGVGDPIVDDLLRAGVPCEPMKLTNEMKKEIIEKMVIWIEQQKIHILNIPETIREFNNFTYDITATGKTRYSAPTGLHDDIVIAHALAVWNLQPLYKQVAQRPKTIIEQMYDNALGRNKYDETAEWSEYEAVES